MEEWSTLGSVKDGQRFIFGGVIFIKESNEKDEMVRCKIGDTQSTVYISNLAVVGFTVAAEADIRRRVESHRFPLT